MKKFLATKLKRRRFFKGLFAFSLGIPLLKSSMTLILPSAGKNKNKVSISSACVDCWGCIPVCPTDAISMTSPVGLHISNNDCISCGYCVAACPANALKVNWV